MNKTNETKSTPNRLTINPKKFVITILLILLPIFIIVLTSLNFNRRWNRINFSDNDTPQYVYQNDMISNRKIEKYMDLNIKLNEVPKTVEGNYKFNIYFVPTSDYKSSLFNITPIMKPNWVDEQSSSQSFTPTSSESTGNKTFSFTGDIPEKRFKVFNVGRPNLYLKITIKYIPSNPSIPTPEAEDIVIYYKFDVNKTLLTDKTIEVK